MTDNKLKIRIKIPQSSQYEDDTRHHSIPVIPEVQKDTEKAPFDMQKIFITLFVVFLSISSLVYLVFIDETQPKNTTTEQNIITHYNETNANAPIPAEPVEHLNEPLLAVEEPLNSAISQSIEGEPLDAPHTTDEQNSLDSQEPIIALTENIEENIVEIVSVIPTTPNDQSPVIQAQLTSAIHQREPVDEIDHIELNQGASVRIHFFMRLRDLAGQHVSVRWFYLNNEVAKLDLPIGNNEQWRTHANKLLSKTRLGQWHVELHDASGNLLAQRYFTVSNKP